MKRILLLFFTALLLLSLTACRSRTTVAETPDVTSFGESGTPDTQGGPLPSESQEPQNADDTPDPDTPTEIDPKAEHRTFSDTADAELTPDAENALAGIGQGEGSTGHNDTQEGSGAAEAPDATQTATETVGAENAEKTGADETGETADSAMTYYETLLADRLGSLFECQRLYVYWETAEDHVTVHKSSQAHQVILNAGAYDCASKLAADALTVDDGWIARKNPSAVVKIVDSSVLGSGVFSTAGAKAVRDTLAARDGWAELDAVKNGRIILLSQELLTTQARRTAAEVLLAKAMYPSLMSDTDAEEALRALTEEIDGRSLSGTFIFVG